MDWRYVRLSLFKLFLPVLLAARGWGRESAPCGSNTAVEISKDRKVMKDLGDGASINDNTKAWCSLIFLAQWLHLLSGKQPLKTEKVKLPFINCLQKILYLFYISCRCTIKFGLVNYSEKMHRNVNLEQSVITFATFYLIDKSMSALKSTSTSYVNRHQVILYG